MSAKILSQTNLDDLNQAADYLAQGEVLGIYFNATYAFIGDADQSAPADLIFRIKNRPRTKSLSLICDPIYFPEFIDQFHPVNQRFPYTKIMDLWEMVHAIGLVFPANESAPADLIQNNTILNVWSHFEPLIQLQALCRERGVRALKGASANPSGEPTYIELNQIVNRFGNEVVAILDQTERAPECRHKSTSIVNLVSELNEWAETAELIREGNVPHAELCEIFAKLELGDVSVSPYVKIL